MEDKNFIGNRLKMIRKSRNYSMSELGDLSNTSASFISDIENGKSIPSINKIMDICNALEISISDFLDESYIPTPIDKDSKELLEIINKLSYEQKIAIKKLLETLIGKN